MVSIIIAIEKWICCFAYWQGGDTTEILIDRIVLKNHLETSS